MLSKSGYDYGDNVNDDDEHMNERAHILVDGKNECLCLDDEMMLYCLLAANALSMLVNFVHGKTKRKMKINKIKSVYSGYTELQIHTNNVRE